MLMTDYTTKLLNLEDVIITGVENISDKLHISIELPRRKHACPCCGAETDRVHDYRLQIVKDVPLARDTFLHLVQNHGSLLIALSHYVFQKYTAYYLLLYQSTASLSIRIAKQEA